MPWLQIRIPTRRDDAEVIEDALMDAGCQAVTLLDSADHPVYEPQRGSTLLWPDTTVQGLFEDGVDADALKRRLTTFMSDAGLTPQGPIVTEILEDKDWVRSWMDDFEPIRCGDRLWICPSWLAPPDPEAVNLRLDPGLAFGSGTHPTTRLCLNWLDRHIQSGERVLDFGCGSGILGLAALLLGAAHMDGLDIDPQALDATRANAEANGIAPERYRVMRDETDLEPAYDRVVANILAAPLCELAESLCQRLSTGGSLALSGILEHQADTVMAAYAPWIDFDAPVIDDGWIRLSGRRR